MNRFISLLMIILATGCSDKGKENSSATPPSKSSETSSIAKDAIEGLTGKTAVMAGEKAKAQIKAISAEQNKKLNEVLDDK